MKTRGMDKVPGIVVAGYKTSAAKFAEFLKLVDENGVINGGAILLTWSIELDEAYFRVSIPCGMQWANEQVVRQITDAESQLGIRIGEEKLFPGEAAFYPSAKKDED